MSFLLSLQVVEEGVVKLKQLQILGKPDVSSGLAIFSAAATLADISGQQQVFSCHMYCAVSYMLSGTGDQCHRQACRHSNAMGFAPNNVS